MDNLPSKLETKIVDRVLEKEKHLYNTHHQFLDSWDDVTDYIIPNKSNAIFRGGGNSNNKGEKKNLHLYDTTAPRAAVELADALQGLTMNPMKQWFELTTGIAEVDSIPKVKVYLQTTQRILLNVFNRSNLYLQANESFLDLTTLATGPIRIEEDDITHLRFYSFPVYQAMVEENDKQEIDVLYRNYKPTIRQVYMKWGDKTFNNDFKELLKNKSTTEVDVVHAVEPRENFFGPNDDFQGAGSLPYVSFHVSKKNRRLLSPSFLGFHEFPYAVPRWRKLNDEFYGRGPGWDTLPDAKTANAMKKTYLQGSQLRMAPPMQTTDNSLMRKPVLKPFGMNYRRPGSDKIEPLFSGADPGTGDKLLETIKNDIKEGFYLHLLRLIQQDRMTAEEVVTRRDENFRGLGSILFRISDEFSGPVVNRGFGICERRGLFPQAPQEILEATGGNLDIRYTSEIARAQKSLEADKVNRAIQNSAGVLQVQPEALDIVDGESVLRDNLRNSGVDEKHIRSGAEIAKVRQQKAEMLKKAQESRENKDNASAVKDVMTATEG